MEAKDRIKALLNYLGISGLSLTKELKLNPNTIKQITGGYKQRIDEELANAIVSKYNQIDKLWLLTGDGEMLTQKEDDDNIRIIATPAEVEQELLREELKLMREELILMREEHSMMREEQSMMREELSLLRQQLTDSSPHFSIGIASDQSSLIAQAAPIHPDTPTT